MAKHYKSINYINPLVLGARFVCRFLFGIFCDNKSKYDHSKIKQTLHIKLIQTPYAG